VLNRVTVISLKRPTALGYVGVVGDALEYAPGESGAQGQLPEVRQPSRAVDHDADNTMELGEEASRSPAICGGEAGGKTTASATNICTTQNENR
jgi:hypothetical protein